MIIIFGTRGRVTTPTNGEVLQQACPNCGNDLELRDLKTWFTLFFIPVFPIDTVETFYQCRHCESSYKQSARKVLLQANQDKAQIQQDGKKLFAKTLAATMTHMAIIDGHLDATEQAEIDNALSQFPEYLDEIRGISEEVKTATNPEEKVYGLLRQCREQLTSEAIMSILAQAMRVLLADGKIDKEEEKLMKEYLLVCDLPKEMYSMMLEKMKNDKQLA